MTPMTLSQAIRIGAMLRPQRYGGGMNGAGTCALGAACDAAGIPELVVCYGDLSTINYAAMARRWPILDRMVTLPTAAAAPEPLYVAIYMLNDCDKWTREEIAVWVSTIEQIADQGVVSGAGIPSVHGESTTALVGELEEVVI